MYWLKKISTTFRLAVLRAATFGSFCMIIYAAFAFPIARKLNITLAPIGVQLTMFGKRFVFYITDGADTGVLAEVFLAEEYNVPLATEPKVIIDVGSHVGCSVIYLRLKYPNAQIISCEPDPVTYQKLLKNTAQFSNIVCLNTAVSDSVGTMPFYVYPGSSMSSSLIKRQENQKAIDVPVTTLAALMQKHSFERINLLKFDVEGAEYNLCKELLPKKIISTCIGEVHLDLMKNTEQEFLGLFNGYTISKTPTAPKRYILNAHL